MQAPLKDIHEPLLTFLRCFVLPIIAIFITSNTEAQKFELVIPAKLNRDYFWVGDWSPAHGLVATGNFLGKVQLWDTSGQFLREFEAHEAGISQIAISPDGKTIATGNDNSYMAIVAKMELRLWNTAGERLGSFGPYNNFPEEIRFSADGSSILLQIAENSAHYLINLKEQSEHSIDSLGEDQSPIESIGFFGGSNVFYVKDSIGKVSFWDTNGSPKEVVAAPGGQFFLVRDKQGRLERWDLKTDSVRSLPIAVEGSSIFGLSPNGETIALGLKESSQNTYQIQLWNTAGQLQQTLTGLKGQISCMAFSPDGKQLGVGTKAETASASLFSLDSNQEIKLPVPGSNGTQVLVYSDHDAFLSTQSIGSNETHWWTADGKALITKPEALADGVLKKIEAHRQGSNAVALLEWLSYDSLNLDHRNLQAQEDSRFNFLELKETDTKPIAYSPKWLANNQDARRIVDFKLSYGEIKSGHELFFSPALPLKARITSLFSFQLEPERKDSIIQVFELSTADTISSLQFLPKQRIASFHTNGLVQIWDLSGRKLEERKLLRRFAPFYFEFLEPLRPLFSPDESRILYSHVGGFTALNSNGEREWASKIEPIKDLESFDPRPYFEGYLPGTDYLIHASQEGPFTATRIFDQEGKLMAAIAEEDLFVKGYEYFPKRHWLVTHTASSSRIWDLTTNTEVATLVAFGEKDWVLSASDGRWDASENAQNLLYYVVDYEGRLETIELEQIKERFYTPNLLEQLISQSGTPKRNQERLSQIDLFPKLEADLKENKIEYQLQPRNGGIGRLSLFINGKEVAEDINPSRLAEETIDLEQFNRYFYQDSLNQLALRVYNEEGWLKSKPLIWSYPSPPTAQKQRSALQAHLYALVVGTSDYKGEALDLQYAAKDANDVYQALQVTGKALFSERTHIKLLTTDAEKDQDLPTKENIEAWIKNAKQEIQPVDIVLIYFAGHGSTYGQAEHTQFHYLTMDMGSFSLSDSGVRDQYTVSTKEIRSWLNQMTADKQAVILDACHSGQFAKGFGQGRGGFNSKQIRALTNMKDRTGVIVLAGSAADKESYESSQFSQGLLTYSLLNGMRILAGRNQGQNIKINELFAHCEDEVPELAKNFDGIQKPQVIAPKGSGNFSIGILKNLADIPLSHVKPLLIHSTLIDTSSLQDVLRLGAKLDAHFEDVSLRGATAPYLFRRSMSDSYPEGHAVRGLYSRAEGKIKIKVALFKGEDKVPNSDFERSYPLNQIDLLIEELIYEVELLLE